MTSASTFSSHTKPTIESHGGYIPSHGLLVVRRKMCIVPHPRPWTRIKRLRGRRRKGGDRRCVFRFTERPGNVQAHIVWTLVCRIWLLAGVAQAGGHSARRGERWD